MGCAQSAFGGDASLLVAYPSSLDNVDAEILKAYNSFLFGEGKVWKDLLASGLARQRLSPAVYWSNEFRNRIVDNLSQSRPELADELASRPIPVTARILSGIMQVIIFSTITFGEQITEEREREERKLEAKLLKVARHHCKWFVEDADYITVENAMIDSLRVCLGEDLTPKFEVRLRYKYSIIKKRIQVNQDSFERNYPQEATDLMDEGARRMQEMKEKRKREEAESNRKGERLSAMDLALKKISSAHVPVPATDDARMNPKSNGDICKKKEGGLQEKERRQEEERRKTFLLDDRSSGSMAEWLGNSTVAKEPISE